MSSNCRRVLPRQHPLQRQASLGDYVSNTSQLIPRNYELAIRRSDRFKCADLQKQFSVDQVFSANRGVRQKSFAGRGSVLRGSATKVIATSHCKTNVGYVASSAHGQCSVVADNNTCNINLKIVPAIKKRVQTQKGNSDNKKDKVNAERMRKSSKGVDDRYNLKIFLGQNIPAKDSYEIAGSESSDGSDSDSNNDLVLNESKKQDGKELNDQPVVQEPVRQASATSRRAQFRASRIADGSSSGNPALTVTSNLLPATERRPPLMRAMSAPIRLHDENTKTILASKRKSRRRKISSQRSTNTDQINENVIIQSNKSETNVKETEHLQEKPNRKPVTKPRPSFGCDVVTLVSLISSEGSDTEKEESIIIIDSGRIKRPPLLRKSGKSEHDLDNFANIPREFPHMIRRGSIAPLTARLRANRPPTAPPGSIFVRTFETSESKMSTVIRSSSKEDISTLTTLQSSSKENIPENGNAPPNDIQYPEYVRTMKERECWKLFKKMSSKGISVSYDTVLRGMLTPTELRLLQKQKELEDARKAKENEEAEAKNETA